MPGIIHASKVYFLFRMGDVVDARTHAVRGLLSSESWNKCRIFQLNNFFKRKCDNKLDKQRWDEDISQDDLKMNNIILQYQYPYTILTTQGHHTLSRCTSEITYHRENLIDVSWGQSIFDDISWMRGTYSDRSQQYLKGLEENWRKEEEELSKKYPR